jgi:hypothetical protein
LPEKVTFGNSPSLFVENDSLSVPVKHCEEKKSELLTAAVCATAAAADLEPRMLVGRTITGCSNSPLSNPDTALTKGPAAPST